MPIEKMYGCTGRPLWLQYLFLTTTTAIQFDRWKLAGGIQRYRKNGKVQRYRDPEITEMK